MAARQIEDSVLRLKSSLVSYWKFEDNSNDSKDGNNGTDTNISYSTPNGKFNKAAGFTSAGSSVIDIPNASNLRIAGPLTVLLWTKPLDGSISDAIGLFQCFSSQDNGTIPFGYRTLLEGTPDTGKVRLQVGRGGSGVEGTDWELVRGNTAINDSTYHMVAVVYDGSFLRIYVDGVSDATAVAWTVNPAYDTNTYINIGSVNHTGTDVVFANQYIDDLAVFSEALTAQEIADHFSGADWLGSASQSASVSPSHSQSPSASASASSSASLSPSSSGSASASLSLSPSGSQSPSSSESPSPSEGFGDYTREPSQLLPTDDTDLNVVYTDQEKDDVSATDGVYVGQEGVNKYLIHQFKSFVGTHAFCEVEFSGRSNIAPTDSTVYLQIYNRNTSAWETIDSNSEAGENIDFSFTVSIADLTNYKNPSNVIACRVYQLVP